MSTTSHHDCDGLGDMPQVQAHWDPEINASLSATLTPDVSSHDGSGTLRGEAADRLFIILPYSQSQPDQGTIRG